ncbi:predicted protein [Nematostella vectensis]|uniref:Endonuclease/exonuclease/phosphatase domain-containing protein n=1 Tax=Nematostella vectensis TaxID=45351 RepID=A7RPV2_NEMVE|nr:predicted protein [Nematostella vectensis]|eukprot:XP_001638636.1 predicted protein [Nematostella vectensis]
MHCAHRSFPLEATGYESVDRVCSVFAVCAVEMSREQQEQPDIVDPSPAPSEEEDVISKVTEHFGDAIAQRFKENEVGISNFNSAKKVKKHGGLKELAKNCRVDSKHIIAIVSGHRKRTSPPDSWSPRTPSSSRAGSSDEEFSLQCSQAKLPKMPSMHFTVLEAVMLETIVKHFSNFGKSHKKPIEIPKYSPFFPKLGNRNFFLCDTTLGPPLLSSSPGDQQYSPDSTTSCSQSSKPIRKHSLSILTVNCRSLRSERKRCELQSLVDTLKPDIINATETHIDDNVLTAELGLQGYEIYRQDRKCGGGGVLVATKQDSIISSRIHSLEDEHVESVWCKIEIAGTKPLYNGCMYRPPDRQPESICSLDSTLNKITSSPCLPNVLVTGDFNLPDISWDCTDCENKYIVKANPQYGVLVNQAFIDTIHEHSLSQGVTEPTRENNILDLVLTTNPDLISRTEVLNGMSDHSIVLSTVNLKTRTPKKKPRKLLKPCDWLNHPLKPCTSKTKPLIPSTHVYPLIYNLHPYDLVLDIIDPYYHPLKSSTRLTNSC